MRRARRPEGGETKGGRKVGAPRAQARRPRPSIRPFPSDLRATASPSASVVGVCALARKILSIVSVRQSLSQGTTKSTFLRAFLPDASHAVQVAYFLLPTVHLTSREREREREITYTQFLPVSHTSSSSSLRKIQLPTRHVLTFSRVRIPM